MRYDVSAELVPFFDNIWIIDWDLTGRAAETQRVLPAPQANLVITQDGATVFGVRRSMYEQTLANRGRAVGLSSVRAA